MKKILTGIFVAALLIIYSCGSDNITNPTTTNTDYTKVFTTEQGAAKFEIWSLTGSSLMIGYNDIGFKVYINGNKQTSGFVKFFPKMYHFTGSPMHSSPVSSQFNYDASKDMFTGYAVFLMYTDTVSNFSYGWFNYNDANRIDSALFSVTTSTTGQVKIFTDNVNEVNVYMTLMSPLFPRQGLNDFTVIAHKTTDDILFYEADSLEMNIRTWMPLMGHSSSDNVNPAPQGHGVYKGKANFNMSGQWFVYDSLKYNGQFITPTPPPKFSMDVP